MVSAASGLSAWSWPVAYRAHPADLFAGHGEQVGCLVLEDSATGASVHTPLGDQRDDTGTFCDDLLDLHYVGVKHGKLGGDAIERIPRSGLVAEEARVIVNDVDGQVFAQLIEAAFVDRLKQACDYRLVGFGLCVFHALIVAASCGGSLALLLLSAA